MKQILKRVRGVRFGVGVTVGYFDQPQMNLSMTKTVLDEVHDMYPRMTETEVRSALAIFGFRGDKVFETIETLSGGERAKVALCRLMLRHCNFLILDEPTNHLDLYSMAALRDATLIMREMTMTSRAGIPAMRTSLQSIIRRMPMEAATPLPPRKCI